MNRIFTDNLPLPRIRLPKYMPLRSTRPSVEKTKRMLREIAFVLEMTRRVKTEILESRQLVEPATV